MTNPLEAATDRLLRPLHHFLNLQASGGLLLMGASVLAMVVANSPLREGYEAFLALPFSIRLGEAGLTKPLILWINDGLMGVFFLLIGLELKREVLAGHLSTVRQAALPAFAALGGMLAPAAIFALLNHGDPTAISGWAIPAATDIAFALGVLALLGPRVPSALKAFLLSVAIFDDLGVIIVIALFYTSHLSVLALGIAAAVVGIMWLLNRANVMSATPYMILGAVLWVAVLKSGVHATLAGVLVALCIPFRTPDREGSPLEDLEHALHPWVAYAILPLFAFANAGVPLAGFTIGDITHPVPLGVIGGLVIGKPVGILLFAVIAVKLGLAALPDEIDWSHLRPAAVLCGIGFTMSLFIASLAFEDGSAQWIGLERLGILLGSLISGTVGYVLLRRRLAAA